jgi:membrane protease YdiL (CAAX protease family)
MGSIYLRKGNLRGGLVAGTLGFFLLYIGILVGFQVLYGSSHGISFVRLFELSPVVLVLASLNAPKEEIWFRSLFFGKSVPLFGNLEANLLAGPLFALAHLNAQYSQFGVGFQIGFLILVFSLGLFWGYLMQKTNSIIASSLVHAGADVAIFLPILLSLL